ncbi:MAG: hypothetical protein ACXVBE_09705 [Bdellovibrionota bacterium]
MRALKQILFLLLATLISLTANAVEVGRSAAGKIILQDIACAEVKAETQALRAWTESSGAHCGEMPVKKTGNSCEVTIQACLPDHVKKYQDAQPERFGPNCWNLALVNKNLLPYLRMSTNEEMSFFMNSGLCKQLGENEKPRAGDVGAIRETGPSCEDQNSACEIHGFIYVSENLAYSKNSNETKDPYQLQNINKVYSMYSAGKYACQGSNCGASNKVDFFRCRSFKEFAAEAKLSSSLRNSFNALDYVECQVSSASLLPKVFGVGEKRTITNALDVVAAYLQKAQTEPQGADEAFAFDALLVRLRAIQEQISLFPSARVNPGFPRSTPYLDQALWGRLSQ